MAPKRSAATVGPGTRPPLPAGARAPSNMPALKQQDLQPRSQSAAGAPGQLQSGSGALAKPPCAVEVDTELAAAMEGLFGDSNEIVIAAFEVLRMKRSEDPTGTQLLKALGAKSFLAGRQAPAPRVLCFTVRRTRSTSSGCKPYLHLIKPVDADTYEVRHSYSLRLVEEVQLQAGSWEYGGVQLQVLQFMFGSTSAKVEARPHKVKEPPCFGLHGSEELLAFLAITQQLAKQADYTAPRVVGVEAAAISKWWADNAQGLLALLGEFAGQVLQGAAGAADESQARVLVSAKEERDLEQLMDMYAMGLGDVAEFEARLADEYDALQDANIHSLLSNGPQVDSVLLQLRRTARMLEDVEETLQVFDIKLRHMRQDIAAIEQYNNTLQLTERNNTRLLAALKGLLSDLKISSELKSGLQDPPFESERLSVVLQPGWALVEKLARVSPGPSGMSPHLLQMDVVVDAREQMTGLARVFVAKGSAFLTTRLNKVVEDIAADFAKTTDKAGHTTAPDHGRLSSLRTKQCELVQLIQALEPLSLEALRGAYVRAVNLLVRKELRLAVGDLRRAAALDAQHSPTDFMLTKDNSTSRAAAQLLGGSEVASQVSDSDVGLHYGSTVGRAGPSSAMSRSTQGTLASLHMVLRQRAGPPEGSLSMPLNEAWSCLLEVWLPLLLDELQQAARFLLLQQSDAPPGAGGAAAGRLSASGAHAPGRTSASGARAAAAGRLAAGSGVAGAGSAAAAAVAGGLPVESVRLLEELLGGVEAELMVLVEAAGKSSQQVLSLPMLASTTWWLQQVMAAPEATPLVHMLARCHARLRDHLAAYQKAQLAAIEGFASKGSGGVKQLHVLAFTSQFSLLLHHMEQLLAAQQDVAALLEAQQQQQQQQQGGLARRWGEGQGEEGERDSRDSRPTPTPGRGQPQANTLPIWLVERTSQPGTAAGQAGGPTAAGAEGEKQLSIRHAAFWQCRLEVDEVYQGLVGAMFTSLERMALMDTKHGQRLRIENYAYFAESVRPLAGHVKSLAPFLTQAQDRLAEATRLYVEQQLQHSGLWRLLELSARVAQLLQAGGGPHEVAFQAGCSAQEIKALIHTCMKEPGKQLAGIASRIRKHLGTSGLALRMWEATQQQLEARYRQLAGQLAACYPAAQQVVLSPSPEELSSLMGRTTLVA